MPSWPWMQGIDVAVADPIDPTTPEDSRVSVKELIKTHRETIDKVKGELVQDALYDASKHDDLWILRFVLSHKKSKKAVAAAKNTLLFRKEYNLDSKDVRGVSLEKCQDPIVREYTKERHRNNSVFSCVPHPQRGVILYISLGKLNLEGCKNISVKAYKHAYIYLGEWTFQNLDYVTRRTGRLTKCVRLVDMGEMTFSKAVRGRDTLQRDGKATAEMEDFYPQLLETVFVCRPPEWLHMVWSVVRVIMPKRVFEKLDIVTPHKNEKERKRLLKHVSMDDLPRCYGGNEVSLLESWD